MYNFQFNELKKNQLIYPASSYIICNNIVLCVRNYILRVLVFLFPSLFHTTAVQYNEHTVGTNSVSPNACSSSRGKQVWYNNNTRARIVFVS